MTVVFWNEDGELMWSADGLEGLFRPLIVRGDALHEALVWAVSDGAD